MRTGWLKSMVAAGLVVGAAGSWAQEGGPEKKQDKPGPFMLPSLETLKKALKLDPKQAQQIAKLYQEYQPKKEGGGGTPGGPPPGSGGGENGGKMQQRRAELISKIEAVLTEEQRALFKKLLGKNGKEGPKNKGSAPK